MGLMHCNNYFCLKKDLGFCLQEDLRHFFSPSRHYIGWERRLKILINKKIKMTANKAGFVTAGLVGFCGVLVLYSEKNFIFIRLTMKSVTWENNAWGVWRQGCCFLKCRNGEGLNFILLKQRVFSTVSIESRVLHEPGVLVVQSKKELKQGLMRVILVLCLIE